MKIKLSQLKSLIKEEVSKVLSEAVPPPLPPGALKPKAGLEATMDFETRVLKALTDDRFSNYFETDYDGKPLYKDVPLRLMQILGIKDYEWEAASKLSHSFSWDLDKAKKTVTLFMH